MQGLQPTAQSMLAVWRQAGQRLRRVRASDISLRDTDWLAALLVAPVTEYAHRLFWQVIMTERVISERQTCCYRRVSGRKN